MQRGRYCELLRSMNVAADKAHRQGILTTLDEKDYSKKRS